MAALLFFDIDGTLITLDKKHILPDGARSALYKAKENGHKIFINTGRVKSAVDKILLDFGFDGLVCGCGTDIEYEGKELFHYVIEKDKCIEYAEKLREFKCETLFEGRDRLFIEGDIGPGSFMEYIYEYFSQNSDYPIEATDHPAFIFDKFTTSFNEDSDRAAFEKYFGEMFHLISHGPKVVEAVPMGYSKATGISFLMEHLKVSREDCYSFGDSVNDTEMLKFTGHSVGMGNSVPEILEIVEYVTTDIENDGLHNALYHYGLI